MEITPQSLPFARGGQRVPRREFLRLMGGAAFACAAAPATAAVPAAALDLGFSLYGMKDVPLAEAVRACARIGYRNVELCLSPGYPTAPDVFSQPARRALAAQLRDVGLTVSGLMFDIRLSANAADAAKHAGLIQTAGEFAHDVQPSAPPVLETVLGARPDEWDQVKARMRERLQAWADEAERVNAVIALKAHVSSAVNSPERLLWLLRAVESPHLCVGYDYSHFAAQRMPLEPTLTALLPRTKFIHVKDSVGEPGQTRFALPGEGTIDYAIYFRALRRHGYTGPIVVEVSSQIFRQPGYDPRVAAERSFAVLAAAEKASRS